jgi:hypothetical protein
MAHPCDFFNALPMSEQFSILQHALDAMQHRKVSEFKDDIELKWHLYIMGQLEDYLDNRWKEKTSE